MIPKYNSNSKWRYCIFILNKEITAPFSDSFSLKCRQCLERDGTEIPVTLSFLHALLAHPDCSNDVQETESQARDGLHTTPQILFLRVMF